MLSKTANYDPYGNQLTTTGTWPDNKAFLNQPADSGTGLDLLGQGGDGQQWVSRVWRRAPPQAWLAE